MARKLLDIDRQLPDSYWTTEGERGEQVRAGLEPDGIKIEVADSGGDTSSTVIRDVQDARNLAMSLLLWCELLEG